MKMFLTAVVLFGGFCSFVVADEAKPSKSAPKPVAAKSAGPFQVVPLAKSSTLAAKILAERQAKQQSSSAPTVTTTDIPVIALPPQWPSTVYGVPALDALGRVIDKVFVRVRDNRPPSLATPPPAFPYYTTRAPRSYFKSNNEQTQSESYWHNDDVRYFSPSPTPALACTVNPLQTKISHLRQASEHLTAAGMTAQAKQTQAAIKEVEREINRDLLAKKVVQLKELTAEIAQLRKLTAEQKLSTVQKQVVVEVQVIEFSYNKLKALGFDFLEPNIVPVLASTDGPVIGNKPHQRYSLISALNNKKTKQKTLEILSELRKMGVVKTLAEPKLITVNGREASFRSGREVPYPATDDAGNPTIKAQFFGTTMDVVPTVLKNGKILLKIQVEVSEIDPEWNVQSGTSPRDSRRTKVKTTISGRSGETIVIGGSAVQKIDPQDVVKTARGKSKKAAKNNPDIVEMIFTVRAKVIEPMPTAAAPKKPVSKTARRGLVVPPSVYLVDPRFSLPPSSRYPTPATKR